MRHKIFTIRSIPRKYGYKVYCDANKLEMFGYDETTDLRITIQDDDGTMNLYPKNRVEADEIIAKFRKISLTNQKLAIRHLFINTVELTGWDLLELEPEYLF